MKKPEEKKEIKMFDNIPGAEYANAMQIKQAGAEIVFTFISMFGEGEDRKGKVTSKVVMTFSTFERMLEAMKENYPKFKELAQKNLKIK